MYTVHPQLINPLQYILSTIASPLKIDSIGFSFNAMIDPHLDSLNYVIPATSTWYAFVYKF